MAGSTRSQTCDEICLAAGPSLLREVRKQCAGQRGLTGAGKADQLNDSQMASQIARFTSNKTCSSGWSAST
jgi:hypothetical protein